MRYLLLTLLLLFSCENSTEPSDKDAKVQANNIIQIEMGGTYNAEQTYEGTVTIKSEGANGKELKLQGCHTKYNNEGNASFILGQDDTYYYFNTIEFSILKNPKDDQTHNGFYYDKQDDGKWLITRTYFGKSLQYLYTGTNIVLLPNSINPTIWGYSWK